MALGSLVVSLGLDAAEFISGMSRSEQQAKKFGQTVDRAIAAGVIKAEIAILALGAAAKTTAEVFKSLTEGAAKFKDLEETTGASAESLASLAVSAAVAGVSVEDVGGAMNKLTKNLVGVDDESKAAGAALKALGLNVEDFKNLDPAGQYEAVGKALSGYADGAEKVAVAQALFGKSGAEQLKVFKALEEAGGRQTILTQRQIELSDAYADRQAKTTAELKLYAQAAASEALPALTDLTTATTGVVKGLLGIGDGGKEISANNSVKSFATEAADAVAFMADALLNSVQVLKAVGGSFKAVGADIALPFQAAGAVLGSEGLGLKDRIKGVAQAFYDRNAAVEDANKKYADILNGGGSKFRDALAKGRAENANLASGFDPTESRRLLNRAPAPRLDFSGAQRGGKSSAAKDAKEARDEAAKYLEKLLQQLGAVEQLTEAEKVLIDIRSGKAGNIGIVQQEVLRGIAEEIDATKEAKRVAEERSAARKADYDAAEAAAKANEQADRDRLKALLSNTESGVFKRQQDDIEFLRQKLEQTKITAVEYGEAVASVMGLATKAVKNLDFAAEGIGDSFSNAFEDAILKGKGLSDILRSLEQDIARVLIQNLISRPIGDAVSGFFGGNGGGGIGSVVASFFGGGKAIGGPTMPNTLYTVGERRPEVFSDGSNQYLLTGSRRGNINPNPGMGAGGRSVVVNTSVSVPGNTDRRTALQIGAEIGRRVSYANARMN